VLEYQIGVNGYTVNFCNITITLTWIITKALPWLQASILTAEWKNGLIHQLFMLTYCLSLCLLHSRRILLCLLSGLGIIFLRITNLTCHKATTSTTCYIEIWQTATRSWKHRAVKADWLRHETMAKNRPCSAFKIYHERQYDGILKI
jgi:hypothetical protein